MSLPSKGSAISVITYNTLPIGIAGLMLFLAGLWFETPTFDAITLRSWSALFYLGLVASVGGFIVYFMLLKRLSPIILSFVFIIFRCSRSSSVPGTKAWKFPAT